MIIAFDVSHIRQHRAGIGRLALIQLQGLLRYGSQHTYVLHGWGPDLDNDTLSSLLRADVRLSVSRTPRTVKRLYWNYLRTPPLQAFIGRFDIFHSVEPLFPPIGSSKAVVSFNDSAYFKFPQFYGRATAKKWNFLYQRSLRNADAVTVLSESTRVDLMEMMNLPREKIHVVCPPTDPVFAVERTPDEVARVRAKFQLPSDFLLFVGTIEPRKNIPRLIRAFEAFCNAPHKDVSLVIVGKPGWLYDDILKSIKTSRVSHRIRLLDYVPDVDLACLYRSAIIFAFPSLYEGHGYPVVEAMVSGTPVITSGNSSLKELGEGAAIIVDAENVEDISNAINRLYHDEALRRELARKGRERAAQFSVENAAKTILKLYDQLSA